MEAEKTPKQGSDRKPQAASIIEVLGGRRKGVVETSHDDSAAAVDYLISKGVKDITIRNTSKRHKQENAKAAQKNLEQAGWKQWEKDKSIWIATDQWNVKKRRF